MYICRPRYSGGQDKITWTYEFEVSLGRWRAYAKLREENKEAREEKGKDGKLFIKIGMWGFKSTFCDLMIMVRDLDFTFLMSFPVILMLSD